MVTAHAIKLFMIVMLFAMSRSPANAIEQQIVLQPASSWNVSWDDASCQLVRKFGSASDPMLFMLRQWSLDGPFELTVSGKPIETVTWGKSVQIDYGVGAPRIVGISRSGMNSLYGASLLVGVRFAPGTSEDDQEKLAPDLTFENEIRQIAISTSGLDLLLKTGKMGGPLNALRKCTNDLFVRWGVDPANGLYLAKMPKMIDAYALAKVMQQAYPPALARAERGGRVSFVAIIDASGTVTGCHVTQSTEQSLNDRVCQAVLKARFDPARDKNGKAIAWYYYSAAVYYTK